MVTLEELVGRRLVFGLVGPDLTDTDVRLFRDTHAGGIMLYRRNFETPERFRALIDGLEEALGRRLLITTDHEGGRIIMLNRGVTIFPDGLAAGASADAHFVQRQGLIEGRELRRLGVDVNFAPVLDVLTERYSPNIGIRSYGKDPALVGRLGAARIRGMQAAGLSACAKHFPGKGHAPVDAHLGLPVIDSDWAEMHAGHLPPFLAAMEAGVDCIMTSHPLYPRLDPAARMPASFSRLIVTDYLRGEVGYRGVIISDDLEMGAIGELCPIGEATVRTAAAGHDLLLVCHTEPKQRAAHAALLDAAKSGALPRRDFELAASRLDHLASRRPERYAARRPAGGARRRASGPRHGHARGDARDAARARATAAAQRQGGGGVSAPVVPRRPDHGGARDAARGRVPARRDGAARGGPRGTRGGRGAGGGRDRRRRREGARGGRDRALPLRRPPLPVEPRAPGGAAGRGARPRGGPDARSVRRRAPGPRRARASPPTDGAAASSRPCSRSCCARRGRWHPTLA